MRLWSPLIAALIAVTMAIFPIAMPRASAPGVPETVVAVSAGHAHGNHIHAVAEIGHDAASAKHHRAHAASDCDENASGPHALDDSGCCSIGACHALQTNVPQGLSSPTTAAIAVTMTGDEQVDGIVSGRLDRPPRTV